MNPKKIQLVCRREDGREIMTQECDNEEQANQLMVAGNRPGYKAGRRAHTPWHADLSFYAWGIETIIEEKHEHIK